MTKLKSQNSQRGFVLVEVLISVAILLMLAAASIGLVSIGYRAINFNAHSIEATWLAQQGANSLRGLRDTNWLRFSYDKTNCWGIVGDACLTGTPLTAGNYIIDVSLEGPVTLEAVTAPRELDLTNGSDAQDRPFQLDYIDRDKLAEDSDGDGNPANDRDYLSHKLLNPGAIEQSIYYRIVKIDSVTGDPDPHPTIKASVEVHWLESGAPKKIAIPVTLTNYYRENS
ncbi:prepilin-type N-terminal cleavage/methylation domain-containing protein [Patescibacteria group bacterium]|nr:prepilin-type N-terminal cleavage/methylation domain-containing protein [Patescibacteria group bacterium]